MRPFLLLVAVLFAGCGPAPAPDATAKLDPTQESWYRPAVDELASLGKSAERLLASGKTDEAAAVIAKGQGLINRVLSTPKPTLEAMRAASDLDDLYGRMLLRNRHYGWARLQFQKNLARWKNWKPQTEETERRRKAAESAIQECDRGIQN